MKRKVMALAILCVMAVLRVYYKGSDSCDVKDMMKIKNDEYAHV